MSGIEKVDLMNVAQGVAEEKREGVEVGRLFQAETKCEIGVAEKILVRGAWCKYSG